MSDNDNKRTDFLVKFIMCGGVAAAGLALIYGGLSAFQEERGFDAVAVVVLGVGLGALLLRGACRGCGGLG